MDIFQGIVGTVLTLVAGLIGGLHKRSSNRIDEAMKHIETHRRDIDEKLNRRDVKEIVDDKLAPIIVTLQDIKKDCEEIGKDVKELRKKV